MLHAFKKEYCVALSWNFVVACLQLACPFILAYLIDFIKSGGETSPWEGYALIAALVFSQGISFFISEHLVLY